MSGLLFLLSLVGIGLLLIWMVRNDSVPTGGRTTGLFALRHTPAGSPAPRRRTTVDGRRR